MKNEEKLQNFPESANSIAIHKRQACRTSAMNAVNRQRNAFKSWFGVFILFKIFHFRAIAADWSNPYITMDPEYCARQIELVGKMMQNGRLHMAKRPVRLSINRI